MHAAVSEPTGGTRPIKNTRVAEANTFRPNNQHVKHVAHVITIIQERLELHGSVYILTLHTIYF